MPLFHVNLAAVYYFATAGFDQFFKSLGVELVYDHSLVRRERILVGVELVELLLACLHELLHFALVHKRVVRCNADLARVDGLSPQAFGNSGVDIRV